MRVLVGYGQGVPRYVTIEEGENFNALIAGSAQTGKSVLVDSALCRLKGYEGNVLVLDPTGEHAVLSEFGFNVLKPGVDLFINPLALPGDYGLDLLVQFPQYVYGERGVLSSIQESILLEAVEKSETLADVVDRLKTIAFSGGREDVRNAAFAVLNRLRRLARIRAFMGEGKLPIGLNVVDLSCLPGEEAIGLLCLAVLFLAYYESRTGGWSGLIVVDEADRIRHEPVFGRHILASIMDELRKYGTCAWAVAHTLELPSQMLNSARYKFIFRLDEDTSLRRASNMLFVKPEAIARLTTGRCFFKDNGYPAVYMRVEAEAAIVEAKKGLKLVFHAAPKPSKATRLGSSVDEEALRVVAAKYGVCVEELREVVGRVTRGELEKFLAGEAGYELVKKLRKLGIQKSGKLKRLGKALLEYYKHL